MDISLLPSEVRAHLPNGYELSRGVWLVLPMESKSGQSIPEVNTWIRLEDWYPASLQSIIWFGDDGVGSLLGWSPETGRAILWCSEDDKPYLIGSVAELWDCVSDDSGNSSVRLLFLTMLEEMASQFQPSDFRVCDNQGAPISWARKDSALMDSGLTGTLDDAKSFAENLLKLGKQIAISCCAENGVNTVWLTTWENGEGPVWPDAAQVLVSEIYEGV